MRLEENNAGESSHQHLLYFLVHIKHLAVLSLKIQAALMKDFVTYGHCVNFIVHQRKKYALQQAFFIILYTILISHHTICP